MLSLADADLVRRDQTIPGLGVLLDPEAFGIALRRAMPDLALGQVRLAYIRYKPGTNCLVSYWLELDGRQVEVYAKGHRPDAPEKLQKPLERAAPDGPFGPRPLLVADRAVLVYAFPNDAKLPSLTRLLQHGEGHRALALLAPAQASLWHGGLRRLAYKPERRFVGQIADDDGPTAVLRVYTDSSYKPARTNAMAFVSRGALRVARRIGSGSQIILMEWLPGRDLRQAIGEGLPAPAVALVGEALAELHAQEPAQLRNRRRRVEAESLIAVADAVAFVCPLLGEKVQRLARWLASALKREPPVGCAVHGDFHAGQVVLAGDGVGLLDLDEAVRGDPAADLGNFAAHLERDALAGVLPAATAASMYTALFEGYRLATRRAIVPRVELYTAACLLRLALHPFRDHQPGWPEQTEALVERVAVLLRETHKHLAGAA